jgi:hypothetical protein
MMPHPAKLVVQVAAAWLVGCLGPGAPAPQEAARGEYRPGFDVVDYDVTLDLPDSGRVIRGTAILTVGRTANCLSQASWWTGALSHSPARRRRSASRCQPASATPCASR